MKTKRSWRILFSSLLIAGFSFAFASSASAATRYFNFGATVASPDGSQANPYTTTAQFTTNMVAGDTAYVTGTLTSLLGIQSLVGTASAPTKVMQWTGQSRLSITNASGSAMDIVDTRYLELSGVDVTGSTHGIFLHKNTGTSSNITFSDLTAKSTSTGSGNAIEVDDTSTITISNVTSTSTKNAGISLGSGDSSVTISDVTITTPTGVGIGLTTGAGITGLTITRATVTNAGLEGIKCANNSTSFVVTDSVVTGSGAVTSGKHDISVSTCNSSVIRGNVTRNANGASGIWISSSNSVTVDRNMSSGHTTSNTSGISVISSSNTTITNNVSYGNDAGIFIKATTSAYTGTVMKHNTIYNNANAGVVYVEASGGSLTDVTFADNIVYTANNAGVNGFTGNGPTWNTASNYNLYYLNGATAKMETGSTTLADWRTNQGIDANSSTGDPLFTNTTSGSENLTLQNTSPAIDGAVGSTLTTDYSNTTRPYGASGVNDIGAYETQTPVSTNVSMATAASVSDTTGQTLTLTITDSANPATTTYAVATNSGGTTWLTATGGTSSTPTYSTSKTWTHTNLTANTAYSYYFRIADSDQSTYLALSSAVTGTTALAAPSALTLASAGATSLSLSWTAPSGTVTTYTVSYGITSAADTTTVTDITGASTTITGLTAGTTYYVKVRGNNSAGAGAYSSASSFPTLPDAPTNVRAEIAGGTSATISWTAPGGIVTSYTVSYGTTAPADTTTVSDITSTSTTLTDLTAGTYYFKVRAHNASGAGEYSSAVSLSLIFNPPQEITPPAEAEDTLAQTTATLGWVAVDGATGYRISYGTDALATSLGTIDTDAQGGVSAQSNSTTVSLTIENLNPDHTYYWKVSSNGPAGYGEYSTISSFTTLPHTSMGLLLTPGVRASSNLRVVNSDGKQLLSMFTFWPLRVQTDVMTGDINGDGWLDIAAGAIDTWSGADIRFFDRDGNYLNHIQPFGAAYRGGVDYALADVNGDRDMELIVIPRVGSSNLRVYDLDVTENTWELMDWVMVFGSAFRGGSTIAAGDTNGDGRAEIAIHPRVGSSNLQLYRVNSDNELVKVTWFQPYGSTHTRGITMMLTDYDGDNKAEIVTLPQNGASQLRVFNVNNDEARITVDQLVYPASVIGSFNLASGDVNGDGTADIAVVPQAGNGADVKVYKYDTVLGVRLQGEKIVFDPAHRAGTNLTIHDLNQDGKGEIIVGSAYGRPNTRIYDFSTSTPVLEKWFWAFKPAFSGGVAVSH